MAATGIVLAFFRFYFGFKPDILDVKVFAVYSKYLDTKAFQVVHNQLIEEVSGILVVIGLFLAAFSKMKIENEQVHSLRFRSFLISAWLNIVFVVAGLVFTFGLGYVFMLIMNSISWLVFYLIIFSMLYRKHIRSAS